MISRKEIRSRVDMLEYTLLKMNIVSKQLYFGGDFTNQLTYYWTYRFIIRGKKVYG